MKRSEIKRRPLSDTVLASLEPDIKEYREQDGDGLCFRVKPDGQKSWQLRYKTPAGKWKRSWLPNFLRPNPGSIRDVKSRIFFGIS